MKRIITISLLLIALLSACRKQPDYVLSDKAMEEVLIDIHKTEAVISFNPTKYPSLDKKRALREAVYMRHNTTKAEFDSSMVWYGQHLDTYMDIYERVINRLEAENEEVKKLIAQDNSQTLTRAGDTIDIWKQTNHHIFNSDKGDNVLAFSITTDENFKPSDHFLFQIYVTNAPKTGVKPQIYLAIRHNQQTVHYNYGTVEREGWNIFKIQSDSAANLSEIYGYIAMPPRHDRHIMYVDSISLMRIHDKPGMPRKSYKVIDTNPDISKKKAETKRNTTATSRRNLPQVTKKVSNQTIRE